MVLHTREGLALTISSRCLSGTDTIALLTLLKNWRSYDLLRRIVRRWTSIFCKSRWRCHCQEHRGKGKKAISSYDKTERESR